MAGIVEVDPMEEGPLEIEMRSTLEITLRDLENDDLVSTDGVLGWEKAKSLIEDFKPVPWFIWRMANFVFCAEDRPKHISEGMVLGLKNILLAAASDPVMGGGKKFTKIREAIQVVPGDVVAAASVIHSVSRRLKTKQFEGAWRPILDDALLRAHIGYFVGHMAQGFGSGRGMLAGFAGRAGLAILIATGSEKQAEDSLRFLTFGNTLKEVGLRVYGIDPLQISAITLSASGCGRDAAYGTLGYATAIDNENTPSVKQREQQQWLAAFRLTEAARTKTLSTIDDGTWKLLGFHEKMERDELPDLVRSLIKGGHGWDWLL